MKPKLLLVEDTPTGESRARRLLGEYFQIIAVRNPRAAKNYLAGTNEYAVVVTNLALEDESRIDYGPRVGLRLIRDLRRQHPEIVLVAWTKQSAEYQEDAVAAGANLAIEKYHGDEEMAEQILSLLSAA